MALYDNHEGHSTEGYAVTQRTREFVARLLEDFDEHSALELLALVNLAAGEAFCEVSLRRRFEAPKKA